MIVTTKHGRKKSILTPEEVEDRAGDIISNLSPEEQDLLFGLLDDDTKEQLEVEMNMLQHRYHTMPVSMEQFIEDPYYLGESCSTLYPTLRKDLIELFNHPYREFLTTGAIGVGKCVTGDTNVTYWNTGERIAIEKAVQLDDGNAKCLTYDKDLGDVVWSHCRYMRSGVKKVGDLKLWSGKSMGLSPDHPVLTPSGYKCVNELKPGDLVATARMMPEPLSTLNISDDEVAFVGYMLADGSFTGGSLYLVNATDGVISDFKKRTDCIGKSVGKRVPSQFWGLNNDQLALFLRSVWSCDGWFCKRGGSSRNWEAGIVLGSKGFVDDIHHLLLRFGILSRYRERDVKYDYKDEKRESKAWSLQILGSENVLRFLREIGPIVGKEKICSEAMRELEFVTPNSNVDITPVDCGVMKRIRREIGPISKKEYWPRPPGKQKIGRNVWEKLTDEYTLPEWCSWWGDVFWDRVERYTLREGFEPVYDVEVPSTHNFLAHGIVVHNTFSLSIAVCRILYDLSCLINPQKTFGLSSGTEMVIPLISKSLWLARAIIKTAVDDKIKESPYFMEKFAPRFSKDSTLFPNNIRVIIGSYGSERILGSNVFSAILDECLSKFSLISVNRGGKREKVAIGDLLAMGPEERADCKIVSLDHDQQKLCAGWWRIKESTVQQLVEIKTARGSTSPSLEHPVLVRRGEWCVYVNAVDVVPGDYVVVEEDDATQGTEVEHVGDDASELEFAGVRPERIRVCDIPDGLTLEKVIFARALEPEQTYSLCTEHKTFIADGFVVHNTNFPPKRNSQQITTAIGQRKTAAHFDPVEKVYRNLVRRIKSRFQKAGGEFPGMVMLASSAATLESFTERKVRESREDPLVFVRDHTPWTAKPETEFCGEKFWVVCSTSSLRARILEEEEYDSVTDEYLEENDAWLIDVPIEYLTDFETDIENALRDIAGISTQAISSFIQRPEAVDACATSDIIHAFSLGEWTAGGPGGFLWREICKQYERTLPGGYKEEAWAPRMNPKKLRWCHIDTSLSGDATGFCVGHIDRWVEVVRRSEHGEHFQELAPFYVIDVVLRINPPPGEQIYLPDIRRLVYELQAHGYSFAGLSTDTYQYAEMHQQVRRRGVTPHIVSMDRTTEPYDELKRAIYEDRIRFHKYEPFIEELKNLEYDRLKGKIDHPQSGSKDIADAVAGTVFSLLEHSARLPIALGSDTSNKSMHSDSWVSRKIPASNVDIDDVRERIEDANDDSEFVPILFGD